MRNILMSALMLFVLSSFSQAADQPVMKITDIKGVTHQIPLVLHLSLT